MNQDEFNKIADLRQYLLRHPDATMVTRSCAHLLGDEIINYLNIKGFKRYILRKLISYISRNPELRFTQSLVNLYIIEQDPFEVNRAIDPYNDTDEEIVRRIDYV